MKAPTPTTLEQLAKKFLADENYGLLKALSYAAFTITEAIGAVSAIAGDIVFSSHAYNQERKESVMGNIGAILYGCEILAYTCGISTAEAGQQYVNETLVKNKLIEEESKPSMLELMKHIKTKLSKESQFQLDKR